MKRLLLSALLVASPLICSAGVSVNLNVGAPGYYGPVDIAGAPAPVVVYQTVGAGDPLYLYVPTYYYQNWPRYCHYYSRYNACNRPVFFVQAGWYNNIYVGYYRSHHGYGGGYYNSGHNYGGRGYGGNYAGNRTVNNSSNRVVVNNSNRTVNHGSFTLGNRAGTTHAASFHGGGNRAAVSHASSGGANRGGGGHGGGGGRGNHH